MCRNIKLLYNFAPPATEAEIKAASLQFIRKVTGTTKPSQANEPAFNQAIDEVARSVEKLFAAMVTTAPARDREVEAQKTKARHAKRFGIS